MDQATCDVLKAMGDSSRFRILVFLTDKPHNVSEIVRALGLQQSLVSHHLKTLRKQGLLEAVRNGPFVQYSISCPEVGKIIDLARTVAAGSPEKGD